MPVHYLKINTIMVCGGCTSTVEKALLGVPGVSAVSVSRSSQSARVDTTSDEAACKCTKTSEGKCPCGDACQCMDKALIAACEEVGFDAVVGDESVHKCSSGSKAGPCGSPGCTCGPDCQCGPECQCAGCPGSAACGAGEGPCGSKYCTCGPNCQCGPSCQCPSCPKPKALFGIDTTTVAVGVALFAIGWMASKRFG